MRHVRGTTALVVWLCTVARIVPGAAVFAQRTLVDIVVARDVKDELRMKLDRLAADLNRDGYAARISSWAAGQSAEDVWNHLKDAYDNDNLQGALLVGHVPPADGDDTDIPYWNMDSYQSTSPKHIWVSRFYGPPSSGYGDEVALLSNALDANHYYRTGRSRLPHKAWVHSCATGDNGYCRGTSAGDTWAAEALDTWKTSEAVDPDGLAEAVFELGGDILDETSHGSNSRYAKGSVSITKLHRYGCNIRFVLASSCRTAGLGGVINTQNIVDGTQNVLSIGATGGLWQPGFRIMESSDRSFRSRINSGMPWGKALVASYTFSRQSRKMTIMYGDLSLSSNTREHQVAPENGIPTISLCRPVPGRPMVGEPVRFTAVVEDPDDDPLEVEWFVGEARDATTEYVISNVTDDTVTFSYSYKETGTVRPYVAVRDPWMTGGRSERLELKVGDPAVVNLKTLVSALDPELVLAAESTEDKALVRAGSAGDDQRHVWDMEPYRHGRFRFRCNENGYGLYRSGFEEGDSVYIKSTVIQWAVDTVGGGLYRIGYIYGHLEDRFLTVDEASAGTPVRMRARQESDAQLWYIEDYRDDATTVRSSGNAFHAGGNIRIRDGVVRIDTPEPGPVSLTVFTVHGRRVAGLSRNADAGGWAAFDISTIAPVGTVRILRIDGRRWRRLVLTGLR